MNELIVNDDPEPGDPNNEQYPENFVTGLRYEDDGLASEYRELERQQQEKVAVAALCVQAETLFRVYEPSGDIYDQTIAHEDATLRRRRETRSVDNRTITTILYFFNDNHNEAGYCRVWTNASDQVNWCYNEQRHEPAAEVQAHLHEVFPPIDMRMSARRFGKLTLPRILG
ncbi:MAG: hypothetical protein JWM00_322 [Candidatus Saccharibacteria bacterium]|nr:hypothetical protein [Candidatus Saccharibacteria bacterium]